jgi:hypothetical protein
MVPSNKRFQRTVLRAAAELKRSTPLMRDPNRPVPVPTSSLIAYLLTVLAWELEMAVLLLHAFTNRKLDPLGHTALLCVSLSMTWFSCFKGKRDFQRLKWTRGRIPITRSQGFIITAFMIAFSTLLAWIAQRLMEH